MIKKIIRILGYSLAVICIFILCSSLVLVVNSHINENSNCPKINSFNDYTIYLHYVGSHTNMPIVSNLFSKIPGKEVKRTLNVDEEKYPYYALLNDDQKIIYEDIYTNIMNYQQSFFFSIDTLSESEVYDSWRSVMLDHPEIFWLENECYLSEFNDRMPIGVHLKFNKYSDDIEKNRRDLDRQLYKFTYNIKDYDSIYDKISVIHDKLSEELSYDGRDSESQNIFEAVMNSNTACAGYSKLFQYILQRLNIPCYYVEGYSFDQKHAWNIVKINGEYYNIDVTWDDSVNTRAFFMRTDTDFSTNHERRDLSINLVSCNGIEYNNDMPMPNVKLS